MYVHNVLLFGILSSFSLSLFTAVECQTVETV